MLYKLSSLALALSLSLFGCKNTASPKMLSIEDLASVHGGATVSDNISDWISAALSALSNMAQSNQGSAAALLAAQFVTIYGAESLDLLYSDLVDMNATLTGSLVAASEALQSAASVLQINAYTPAPDLWPNSDPWYATADCSIDDCSGTADYCQYVDCSAPNDPAPYDYEPYYGPDVDPVTGEYVPYDEAPVDVYEVCSGCGED